MRVVAGSAKGRRLVAPEGVDTRPTSDRVREAVCNALASLGALGGAEVLDLFAGSGALGIEALSRGAARCTFVERSRRALAALRQNLAATGLTDRAEVVPAEALPWLASLGTPPARHFDVAFLDPPYAFNGWTRLLADLPAGLAVVESDREVAVPAPWYAVRVKRYGGTVVSFARRAATEP